MSPLFGRGRMSSDAWSDLPRKMVDGVALLTGSCTNSGCLRPDACICLGWGPTNPVINSGHRTNVVKSDAVVDLVELLLDAGGLLIEFLSSVQRRCFLPDRAGLLVLPQGGV